MRLIQAGQVASATDSIKRKLFDLSGLDALSGAPRRHSPVTPSDEIIEGEFTRQPEQPSTSSFTEHSFVSLAGSRRYKLFVPSSDDNISLPLIVMLHGCTQTPDDFALGTRMNELAATYQCVIAYPEQSNSANGMKCWNWFKSSDQRRDFGEPAIIAGITREIVKTHRVDATRVYVAGLSAGGAMAAVMGRTYPDIYAAVGVHSGIPYAAAHDAPSAFAAMKGTGAADHDRLEAEQPMPAILMHGDSDKIVHLSNAQRLVDQYLRREMSGPIVMGEPDATRRDKDQDGDRYTYTRTHWHNANGKVMVEYWLVHGAGHAWFGGNPQGSHTDLRGPDASNEMLRFFLEHKLTLTSDGL
jgi:poly(hydroxyalkanoate) depolymerase family esterase